VSRGFALPPEGWTAYEIVILILIALSVMLAVLTIFLAVLGVLGYQTIRSAAEQKAT
jgi:heme/copper-type cytochrome/quinol oxidase subunit 2